MLNATYLLGIYRIYDPSAMPEIVISLPFNWKKTYVQRFNKESCLAGSGKRFKNIRIEPVAMFKRIYLDNILLARRKYQYK